MTASRNSFAGCCLALVLFACSFSASAQTVEEEERALPQPRLPATGQPIDISPSPYLEKGSIRQRSPIVPVQAEGVGGTPGQETSPAPQEPPPPGLEESELLPLTPGAIGLLGPHETGYPADLWQGTRPGRVIALLSELPAGSNSPAANAMARKLLLSPAPLPQSESGAFETADYIYARLERLAARGDLASLLVLFEQIPRIERSPRIARLMTDAYLLDGDLKSACELAGEGQREEGSAYWLEIAALCYALEGEAERARFNLALLQETGEAEFAFASLLEDILALSEPRDERTEEEGESGETAPLSFFSYSFYLASDLTPLHVGVLKVLGRKVEIDLSAGAPSNLMLSALARWPGLPIETKLQAADIALERGILRESFLRDLVASYRFDPADKENPQLLDYESWGVKSDALFYALAMEAADPEAAARFVQEGWNRAHHGNRAAFIAPLYQETLAKIPPDAARLWFAPNAARIALLNGDLARAAEWYALVRDTAAGGDATATRMLVEMWPLMIIMDAGGDTPYSPQILTLWRRSLALLPVEEQMTRALYLYAALEALGYEVPVELRAEALLTAGPAPQAAVRGASLGETIVLALEAYGREGPNPEQLTAIIRGLASVGMAADARRLALDALVAGGF